MTNQLDGENLWKEGDAFLAPYAQKNADSLGRQYSFEPDPNRLPFQRDCNRIARSTAYRRLRGKMQVLPPEFSDHAQNRFSHTQEVARYSRDIARSLKLNQDLAEAIAMGHDLGHPPFGHSGEAALDEKMKQFDQRFDHNKQSLRIVTEIENTYENHPGLNLSWEVRVGMQKHEHGLTGPDGEPMFSPHLEAQVVDIADEIAYLTADIDDAFRYGFIDELGLATNPICAKVIEKLNQEGYQKRKEAFVRLLTAELINRLVTDTRTNITKYKISSVMDVRKTEDYIVTFSEDYQHDFLALKAIMMEKYWRDERVLKYTEPGEEKISRVFDILNANPSEIPDQFLPGEEKPGSFLIEKEASRPSMCFQISLF